METHLVGAPKWSRAQGAALGTAILALFAVAYLIGTEHLLTNDARGLVPPIVASALLVPALFLSAYALSPRFRAFVLAQDVALLSAMQLWRVIGFAFLTLYAYQTLPAVFALPAGLGDVAIGLAAAFIVARVARDPDYMMTSGFVRFHLLGLLDFVVAALTAGLAAGAFPGLIPNGVTSAPMDVWPLNLFPSFIVPIFVVLHFTVLLKVREMRRAARARPGSVRPTGHVSEEPAR